MQKTTKAMVAVGAAIALMLGGGGSLAYWQKSTDTTATTFTTGYMSFDSTGQDWSLNGEAITQMDLATRKLVPGDVVEYTNKMFVEAEGNDIFVAADVTLGGLTAVQIGDASKDKTDAFKAVMTPTYTLTSDDDETIVYPTARSGVFGIDLGGDTIGYLALTIRLEWSDTDDNRETMDAEVTLASTEIIIRQVPAPLPSEEN